MINRKQFYLLVIFGIMYIAKAGAQLKVGVDVGVSYHKLNFRTSNENLILLRRVGNIININVDRKFNKWLALELSPGLMQKNYAVENKKNIYQCVNNTYIHLPISVKYDMKLLEKLNLSGTLGVYYAYWIVSNISGIAPNIFNISNDSVDNELIQLEHFESIHKFSPKQDNRSEFGWVAKFGVNYMIVKTISSSIKAHYYQSLTDQQKQKAEFQSQKYNQTSVLTIGVAYNFK